MGCRRQGVDGGEDAVGDRQYLPGRGHLLADHNELVPAEPGHGVGGSDDLAERLSHGDELLVACCMPKAIVHLFEVVEVDEQHRHQPVVPFEVEKRPGKPIDK